MKDNFEDEDDDEDQDEDQELKWKKVHPMEVLPKVLQIQLRF